MTERGFGSPADLDDRARIWIPPFTLYAIASRMMTSNVHQILHSVSVTAGKVVAVLYCGSAVR